MAHLKCKKLKNSLKTTFSQPQLKCLFHQDIQKSPVYKLSLAVSPLKKLCGE